MAKPAETAPIPTLPEAEARAALQRYVHTIETDRPATYYELLELGAQDTRLPLALGDFVLHHGTPYRKNTVNYELHARHQGWKLHANNCDYSGSGFRFVSMRGTHRPLGIGPRRLHTLDLPSSFTSSTVREVAAGRDQMHFLYWADSRTTDSVLEWIQQEPPQGYEPNSQAIETAVFAIREGAKSQDTIEGFMRISHHLISSLLAAVSERAS